MLLWCLRTISGALYSDDGCKPSLGPPCHGKVGKLLLSCIDAEFCKYIRTLKYLSISTRFAHVCAAQFFHQDIMLGFQVFSARDSNFFTVPNTKFTDGCIVLQTVHECSGFCKILLYVYYVIENLLFFRESGLREIPDKCRSLMCCFSSWKLNQ